MPTKVREAIKAVEDDGWYYIGSTGSHRHFKHPTKPGKVTIPGKPNDTLAPGTWISIQRQAGLK
jgi:predicted RNA binding protein YcfA (HicA-like mRNA interferase family)